MMLGPALRASIRYGIATLAACLPAGRLAAQRPAGDYSAPAGIAALRMDDRGVGASTGTFKGSTHFDFVAVRRSFSSRTRGATEVMERRSAQKPSRQLLQSLVIRMLGFGQHRFHERPQPWLAPIIPGRPLGELRFVHPRRFQQHACSRALEPRIIPIGKIVVAARHLAFGIVSQKCL
jgi:hypothetical protein